MNDCVLYVYCDVNREMLRLVVLCCVILRWMFDMGSFW